MTGEHEKPRASQLARLFCERNRAYLYRILVTAGPLAVTYGVLSKEDVALWLAFAAQTLGVGLAARHTSTQKGNTK